MSRDDLRDLLGYTEWATARIAAALGRLPDAVRRRRDDSAFGNVHGTFTHLIAAEWVWLERWLGRTPPGPPEWVGSATFDELLAQLDALQRARAAWIDGLRDLMGRARILARIERLAAGNPGDVKPVGEGVSELRIDCGPGYRVYFTRRGNEIVILLAGGDKSTQTTDIKTALRLARNLKE